MASRTLRRHRSEWRSRTARPAAIGSRTKRAASADRAKCGNLLAQQAVERVHPAAPPQLASAAARPTNTSSIEAAPNSPLELRWSAHHANPPVDHDRDAIAVFRFVHVVRGHQHGRAGGGRVVDQLPELSPRDRIDAARRLVQKNDRGSWSSATESASFCRQPSGRSRTAWSATLVELEARQHPVRALADLARGSSRRCRRTNGCSRGW